MEIEGQTFAVRNIGSVKVDKPGTPWIAALIMLGSLIGVALSPDKAAPLIIALIAGVWIWQQMVRRKLVLVTGGGEVVALASNKGALVEELRAAIAKAISAR